MLCQTLGPFTSADADPHRLEETEELTLVAPGVIALASLGEPDGCVLQRVVARVGRVAEQYAEARHGEGYSVVSVGDVGDGVFKGLTVIDGRERAGVDAQRGQPKIQQVISWYCLLDTILRNKPLVMLPERSKLARFTIHRSVPHVRSTYGNK